MKHSLFVTICFLAFCSTVNASNLKITRQPVLLHIDPTFAQIEIRLEWDNSWYNEYNHDAVYLFGKFCLDDIQEWYPLTFAAEDQKVSEPGYGLYKNGQGLVLFRSIAGQGKSKATLHLKWDLTDRTYAILTPEMFTAGKVHFSIEGIEMVYIPTAPFYAGDGHSANSFSSAAFGGIPSECDLIGNNSNFAYTASSNPALAGKAADRQNNSQNAYSWSGVAPAYWQVDFKTPKEILYFGISGEYFPPDATNKSTPSGTWYLEASEDASNWKTLWEGGPEYWSYAYNSYPVAKAIRVNAPGKYRYYRIRITEAECKDWGNTVRICNVAMTEKDLSQTAGKGKWIDASEKKLPKNYPDGYAGFYAMKYEISQEQYVAFLNKQNYSGQYTRTLGGLLDGIKEKEYVFGEQRKTPSHRNGILLVKRPLGEAQPLLFGCSLRPDQNAWSAEAGQTLACNYLSPADMLAYADWSGLRPLSELEYEKMARPPFPLPPLAGEMAWNTTEAIFGSSLGSEGKETESFATGNVNAGNTVEGPVRAGSFTKSGRNRQDNGIGFWGVEDLSGNLSEIYYNAEVYGQQFNGNIHGDGNLDNFGRTDIAPIEWPQNSTAFILRGGAYLSSENELAISARKHPTDAFPSIEERRPDASFRLGISFPQQTYESILTLENGNQSGTAVAYDTVCDPSDYCIRGNSLSEVSGLPSHYSWYASLDQGDTWQWLEKETHQDLWLQNLIGRIPENTAKEFRFKRYTSTPLGSSESGTVALVAGHGILLNRLDDTLQPCMASKGFRVKTPLPSRFEWNCPENGKTLHAFDESPASAVYYPKTADFRTDQSVPSGEYHVDLKITTAGKCISHRKLKIFAIPWTENPFVKDTMFITYNSLDTVRITNRWGGYDRQEWKLLNTQKGDLNLNDSTGVLGGLLTTMCVHMRTELVCRDCPDKVYTLNLEEPSRTLPYAGHYHTLILLPENYTLECYGAQGTNGWNNNGWSRGGYGASTSGELTIRTPQTFYVYVGGQGSAFNSNTGVVGPSGGGATDIRLIPNGTWYEIQSLRSRIMVAAGGGGGCCYVGSGQAGNCANAGQTAGGALTAPGSSWNKDGQGASQTSGGRCGARYTSNYWGQNGSFGVGGYCPNNGNAGSGGGGYYGGGSGTAGDGYDGNGGGGSSFVSGYPGCNAVDINGTHTGKPEHYSKIVFTNPQMSGNVRAGHGYARITVRK